MNAAWLAVATLGVFALAYRFYARFLSTRIFALADSDAVPARQFEDGVDFVPTRKSVLWGHHFTSIAGAAPIVGPAIAVIWGWLPALLWVTLGTVAMGAVHDFSALVISLRNRGRSIGDIAGAVVGPRARLLFLALILLLVWIVLAVFAYIIATLFVAYPGAIFPINVQIAVAMLLGWAVYRRRLPILVPSLLGYAALMLAVWFGDSFAAAFPVLSQIQVGQWVVILLIYCFVASVLPVWLLLQPRDYLNAHQLITGLSLLCLGLFVAGPLVVAPAINPNPAGAPPLIPFLFITIACGAISGFHGLVASGTTAKQVQRASDARAIGFGGMLGEGALGMMAVLASTAGFASFADWQTHYASWGAANGLSAKLEAFVNGGASFVSALGIPQTTAATFIAVMVIAFAATSLDTAARIQRLVIGELAGGALRGRAPGLRALLGNRYAAGVIAVGAAMLLALTQAGGQGGLILWPLFGTTNQLVAGVTLLVVSVWLRKQGRPVAFTLLPMWIVAGATLAAMISELAGYLAHWPEQWLLAVMGAIVLLCDLWVIFEGFRALRGARPRE
ncbi:MAG: carbon starvation protein A [Deltaproteobacteria bacterium]|nr:carbon starvation protein A [Deltaproteobacteria bacterium]